MLGQELYESDCKYVRGVGRGGVAGRLVGLSEQRGAECRGASGGGGGCKHLDVRLAHIVSGLKGEVE